MTDEQDPREQQLRAGLAGLDPAADLPPLDPERRAELLEDAMQDHETSPETSQPGVTRTGRGPLTWVGAAAAAAVIGGVGVVALLGDEDTPVAGATDETVTPDEDVTTTELGFPDATARCAMPRAEVLAGAEVAFAGTVDTVKGGTVVVVPREFYAGRPTDLVELDTPDPDALPLLAVPFEEGGEVLVAANDGSVLVCGYTGADEAPLSDLYAEAFNR